MLFSNESISTFNRGNMAIWMVLAFQAGLLNIGGFLACQTFVSHVTGYATLFGYEVHRMDFIFSLGMLLVPLFFLLGSVLSGVLVDLRIKQHRQPRYYVVFGLMALLLLYVVVAGFNGLFGPFGEPIEESKDYTLLATLCLVCGIQNGTITLVSKSVVRTTHLTGVTTDLGIGIVRVLNAKKLRGKVDEEWRANLMRAGVIVFFILGSTLGYKIYERWAFRGFLAPFAICLGLFLMTLYFQVIRKRLKSLWF